jgi:hypothetical protein
MANAFTELFDKDWKRTRSSLRAQTAGDRSYDPAYSWDARTDDPQAFSKMQSSDVPVQFAKPITMSGQQVIALEPLSGQFLNVDAPSKLKGLNAIPLTHDQQDIDMSTNLMGSVPICDQARSEGKFVTIAERPVFSKSQNQAPKFQVEAKPEFMDRCGPQGDQILLNPKMRREMIEFEKREQEARALVRGATSKRAKTQKMVQGPLFKRGVIQIDSAENMNSDVYGAQATSEKHNKDYRSQIHLERRSQLANLRSSIATNGNLIDPNSVAARVKVNANYQSKGGDFHGLTFEETHNRLFCRQERAGGAMRTQRIRDAELSGKQYNIVTMTTIEHWPSRHFDRLENKSLQHPSQGSWAHGPRNLQGSMRPF